MRDNSPYHLVTDRARRATGQAPTMLGFGRIGKSYMVSYALSVPEDVYYAEPNNYLEVVTCEEKSQWMRVI